MNDYLTSLVTRSLDHGTSIQPRLPSLFEFSSRAEKAFFWRYDAGEGNRGGAAEFQTPEGAVQQSNIRATRRSASPIAQRSPSGASDSKAEPLAEQAFVWRSAGDKGSGESQPPMDAIEQSTVRAARASDSKVEPPVEQAFYLRSTVGEGKRESAVEFQPPKDAIQHSDVRATRAPRSAIAPPTPSHASGLKAEPLAEGATRLGNPNSQVSPSAITNRDTYAVVTRTSSGERPRVEASKPPFRLPVTSSDETTRFATQAATGRQPEPVLEPAIHRVAVEQGAYLKKLSLEISSRAETLLGRILRPSASSQVVVYPDVVRHPTPPTSPALAAQDSRMKPGPAIHVTIGRVEVRAVSATPAQTEKRSVPLPTLSLEEYLHQRSGGGDK
jgi:hypothetical protein